MNAIFINGKMYMIEQNKNGSYTIYNEQNEHKTFYYYDHVSDMIGKWESEN